jgi:thiamine-phosphate pyrophosphorylase
MNAGEVIMMRDLLRLCLVTTRSDQSFHDYKLFILQAIAGGVTAVQWRDKQASMACQHAMAFELKQLLTPLNIPLIINDHVDIAKAVDAEGVHLGQSDGSPMQARAILGPNKIIGLSIETEDHLVCANALTAIDYVAASAVFPSVTKTDCVTIWGLEGLRNIQMKSNHPVIAIGGIGPQNVSDVMACGVAGVAVVSAIHDARDPFYAASQLIRAMQG